MKILVACEESQAVTIELRRLGHEAYSCDIEPCSGGRPEWHIQGDAVLDGYTEPEKPTNKYEAMSDAELRFEACNLSNFCNTFLGKRKHDCPLFGCAGGSCAKYVTDHPELRQTLIQYCLDEDAAKEAKKPTKEMTVAEIEKELGYPVKVVKGEACQCH